MLRNLRLRHREVVHDRPHRLLAGDQRVQDFATVRRGNRIEDIRRGGRAGQAFNIFQYRNMSKPGTTGSVRSSALVTIFVVLRCPLDRQEPAFAPLHPDLGFRLQFEGRLIQTSEPDLDQRVTGTNWIKQS